MEFSFKTAAESYDDSIHGAESMLLSRGGLMPHVICNSYDNKKKMQPMQQSKLQEQKETSVLYTAQAKSQRGDYLTPQGQSTPA